MAEVSGHDSIVFYNDGPDIGKAHIKGLFGVAAVALGSPAPRPDGESPR